MATIGNITVPEIAVSGRFPVVSEFGHGRAHTPRVAVHRMGPNSANGKVEQRYYLGSGAKEFTVRRSALTQRQRRELAQFWLDRRGAEGAFYYDAPNEDGTTTEYVCRFRDQDLSLDFLVHAVSTVGIGLVEIPTSNPSYSVTMELTRFPSEGFEDSLLEQVQEIIPLIRIEAKEAGYPIIWLSDRRCIVGGDQYEPRLLDWDGITQSMDGSSDQASFTFGNADRVMSMLVNDVDLFRADLQFGFYHVATGTKLNLWRGDVTDWKYAAASDTFSLSASDGFHELNQLYPRRKVSRTCWKELADGLNCPFDPGGEPPVGQLYTIRTLTQSDGKPKQYEFEPKADSCDKSWDGRNGCLAHGMENYFGGIIAKPQSVRISWSGEQPLTHTSLIADSIYGRAVPEIYCKITHPDLAIGLPVPALISAGRDEGDFYAALGVIGEGPIAEFAAPRFEQYTNPDGSVSLPYNPHKLDGQDHHGFVSEKQKNNYGLRLGTITGAEGCHGYDPVPAGDYNSFSLGEGANGIQRWGPERAAGTAFIEIRRKDEKGLQLSRLEQHSMETAVRQGLSGWTWTDNLDGTFTRSDEMAALNNPIWIAVNMVLRAKGLLAATSDDQLAHFDGAAACWAAFICDQETKKLIGDGNETQFAFTGIMADQKPLRDWLQEVLNNCLGFYTFAGGKIKFGIRANSSAVEQFSDGNIIWGTLALEPRKPRFWSITGNFADEEYGYAKNSVDLYDETYGKLVGGVPMKAEMNYLGASGKSQVARLIATRLREELGGWRPEVQKVARRGSFRTTLLGLTVEPGTVIRLDHPDLPDYPATIDGSVDPEEARSNHVQARVERWRLNKDFSIDVEWMSLHNEIYDLVAGPKPADVGLVPLPREETFKPANWRFHAYTERDGLLRLNRIAVGTHKETVHRGLFEVYWTNEATNVYGTLVGTIDANVTSFTMSGHPPTDGRWVLIDAELMYVERYEPTIPNFGVVTVKRGQLGTKAIEHTRIDCTISEIDPDNPCHLTVETGLGLRPGSRVVVNDGGGPPYDQQPIASYDPSTGDLYTTLPLTTADPGDAIYSDPRLWHIDVRREEVPFQPRFFSSPNRSKWEHTIDLKNAGVALIRGKLYNTRGIASDYVSVYPVPGDAMEPQTEGYVSEFPHRIRTLGGHEFQWPLRDLPTGVTDDAFQIVRASEAQAFARGYAEVTGGVANALAAPPAVSAVVPTELRTSGTVTLQGSVDEHTELEIRIEGDNEIDVPVWVARDWMTKDIDGNWIPLTLDETAVSVRDWCNGGDHFAAYYTAHADGAAIQITAKVGSGGTIVTDTMGPLVAIPSGMTSMLGILVGRKYAVAFSGAGYTSELSPLSVSTGPTGAAERIEISDIPASGDPRVTNVLIYAAPDGRDKPLYLIASVANGTEAIADTTPESSLSGGAAYGGSVQPVMPGPVIVTLRRNGEDWCRLFIPADSARSNEVHGFALDPVAEQDEIAVDIDNQAEELDFLMNLA